MKDSGKSDHKKLQPIRIKKFAGLQDYQKTWQAMRDFTDRRTTETPDEIWLLQHHPVFTLGQAGKIEHLLTSTAIPVVKTDRGGQITYHGPGQLIAYLLIDLKRRHLGVRDLVTLMEKSLVELLQESGIDAYAKKSAPGVYVQCMINNHPIEHKIASLGLRVRKGCSYHGLALNVDMNLAPYQQINPCGYVGLAVTQLSTLLPAEKNWQAVENKLVNRLKENLTGLTPA